MKGLRSRDSDLSHATCGLGARCRFTNSGRDRSEAPLLKMTGAAATAFEIVPGRAPNRQVCRDAQVGVPRSVRLSRGSRMLVEKRRHFFCECAESTQIVNILRRI